MCGCECAVTATLRRKFTKSPQRGRRRVEMESGMRSNESARSMEEKITNTAIYLKVNVYVCDQRCLKMFTFSYFHAQCTQCATLIKKKSAPLHC